MDWVLHLTGTLQTAAQTNVTSLGTLSALAIAGAPDGTNLLDVQSYPASAGVVSQTSAIRVYQGSYNHPGGGTISSMYGVYISAGAGGETGDIFLGANLYVQTPLFGDRRISAAFEGNVVITSPSVSSAPTLATDLQIHSAAQNSSRLTFSGQEFYQAANTSTDGPAFVLGVNRTNNRQLWLVDSTNASIASTTNYMLRFNVSSTNATIDAMSTDGATAKTLNLGHSSGGLTLLGSVRGSIDDTHFGFDTSDPPRFGMTKKTGFITKLTHGSATSFAIARSSTNDIAATGTFTDELVIDTSGNTTLSGNLRVGSSYAQLSLTGGNSVGFLYGAFAAFGDGIHIGYNYHHTNVTGVIPAAGGATTRFTMGYNSFVWAMGATNTAPTTTVLTIDSSGHLVPGAHNTYDLGTSSNYFRAGYIGSHHLGVGFIEFSNIESGDRVNYIDFHCSNGVDYSARIIRGSGVNGPLDISNTGTGGIGLNSIGNTTISFATNNTNRCYIDPSGHFNPYAHNTYDLGTTALRWRDAWVQRGAFNGSDERVKTQIQPTRFGLDFVRKLQPVSWQWKDTSGDDTALHHGFIAQQVKQVLTDLGATNQDFGGYHDPEDRKQTGFLALAYNEFISPVVAAVQEIDNRGFVETRSAPETSTSPGQRGEFRSSDQYLYACVGENQWKRVAWDQAVW